MTPQNNISQSITPSQTEKVETKITEKYQPIPTPVVEKPVMSIEEKTAILEQLRRHDISDAVRSALLGMLNQ